MSNMNNQIIEIENEYFSIIQDYYGDLIHSYETTDLPVSAVVENYLSNKKTILIPGYYQNNLAYNRYQFLSRISDFWDRNQNTLLEYIRVEKNVGVFGIGDTSFAYAYLEELKKNSLFYDILAFNDPFCTYYATKDKLNFASNVSLFYANILFVWEIKQYISLRDGEVFAVICPFDTWVPDERKELILDESWAAGNAWVNEMFGIDTQDLSNLDKDINLLKEMTLENIQTTLYNNGIYQAIDGALNYSQNLISDEVKRQIEQICIEKCGSLDRDYVNGFLLIEALPTLASINYYTYKLHTTISSLLNALSIISEKEWAPLQRDIKGHPMQVSLDYLYTCAVHRNDDMSALMSLNYDEIAEYHERTRCSEFRDFFYTATKDVVSTHEKIDEIANEVFSRTDALLNEEYLSIVANKRHTRKVAIIGVVKSVLGVMPVISRFISAWDASNSVLKYAKTLDDKTTLIEYIHNRNN